MLSKTKFLTELNVYVNQQKELTFSFLTYVLTKKVVCVFHKNACCDKPEDIKKEVAAHFKCQNTQLVVLYNGETKIGGDLTTFHCCVYKDMKSLKDIEPQFRKIRLGVEEPKKPQSRKAIKSQKNKALKKFGTHARVHGGQK